eukprot:TRINITY_DN11782_c0_g1_i1.p1 TRINITY_DN11782_c0_g1~~TRINITY_DN11782_c0_g1_i1.p1  ORF type:complete len:519 (+),score=67.23 TRINITY_DN11782_c0_g1_i1:149-1558(+)
MDHLVANGINVTRHYTFKFCRLITPAWRAPSRSCACRCSPTRTSLMSGRLPIHGNQLNSAEWCWTKAPCDPRMTMLPAKLKHAANYSTHQIGKWHLGLAKQEYTPHGRGFDTSLGYLAGSEDHYTQRRGGKAIKASGVDLWATDQPGSRYNGTYNTIMYTQRMQDIIVNHNLDQGLFVYLAYAATHEPEQSLPENKALYPESWVDGRREYNGMMTGIDQSLANITQVLKQRGMWNDTLLIFASDNGGPSLVGGPSYANNFPLRGGKGNDFEGGVRTASFVSGGLVPPAMRGTSVDGYIHVADWYATVCDVAGVDPTDNAPGVPPSDSLSMWPMLSGQNSTGPRLDVPLNYLNATLGFNAALIRGDYKIVIGNQGHTGLWWGPDYPNSTVKVNATDPGCPDGCLFDIIKDPSEYSDIKQEQPDVYRELYEALLEYGKGVYQADADGHYDTTQCENAMQQRCGGFWCPWIN